MVGASCGTNLYKGDGYTESFDLVICVQSLVSNAFLFLVQ